MVIMILALLGEPILNITTYEHVHFKIIIYYYYILAIDYTYGSAYGPGLEYYR